MTRSLAVLQLERIVRVYTNGNEVTAKILRNTTKNVKDHVGRPRFYVETSPIKLLRLIPGSVSDVLVQLENGKEFSEAFIVS